TVVPEVGSVAAIFRQMIPDFPMPATMTRPVQLHSSCTAASNRASRRATSARIAAASVSSTLRASLRSAMDARLGLLGNTVDRDQAVEQRLEPVELQRVLGVAQGARRVVVHLEEHAVDAGGNAGRGERLDVLREAGGDA